MRGLNIGIVEESARLKSYWHWYRRKRLEIVGWWSELTMLKGETSAKANVKLLLR